MATNLVPLGAGDLLHPVVLPRLGDQGGDGLGLLGVHQNARALNSQRRLRVRPFFQLLQRVEALLLLAFLHTVSFYLLGVQLGQLLLGRLAQEFGLRLAQHFLLFVGKFQFAGSEGFLAQVGLVLGHEGVQLALDDAIEAGAELSLEAVPLGEALVGGGAEGLQVGLQVFIRLGRVRLLRQLAALESL